MLLLWIPIACILGTISALPQLTVCGSQIVNTFCQMICTTDDFSQIVLFQKDTVSQGGCSSGGTCNTGITGYSIYRSGTQQTILNITAYDRTRDPGDWTCALGASVSTVTTTDYAIPPTSATVTSANNITVNVTTDVTVTTECAYINISGILKLQNTGYSQRQTCDEVPSGGCAAGLGEKYTCTFTFQPTTVAAGTYLLQFHVDLPNDNTDPGVQLTTDTYITFEPSGNGNDCSVMIVIFVCIGFHCGYELLSQLIVFRIFSKKPEIHKQNIYTITVIRGVVIAALSEVTTNPVLKALRDCGKTDFQCDDSVIHGAGIGTTMVWTSVELLFVVLVYLIFRKPEDQVKAELCLNILTMCVALGVELIILRFHYIYLKRHKGTGESNPSNRGSSTVTPENPKPREQTEGEEGRITEPETNEHQNVRHVATSALDSVPHNRKLPQLDSSPRFNDVEYGQRANSLPPLTNQSENPSEKKTKKKKKNKEKEQDENETDVV